MKQSEAPRLRGFFIWLETGGIEFERGEDTTQLHFNPLNL